MENEYKLNQVSVRLKLKEEAPLYSDEQISTPKQAIEVMRDMMKELDREYVCVVNLDGASHPINYSVVSIGSINASPVTMRELFKTAIMSNASSIMMLHNHPSSNITPSKEDHASTARVMVAADIMGIPLTDHIIVGGGTDEYFSYRTELKSMFNIEGMNSLLSMNGIKSVIVKEGDGYLPEKQETKRRDAVKEFKASTAEYFKEISGMSAEEIELLVMADIQNILEDYGMDVRINGIAVTGSRCRGLEYDGSDLDVVVEYKGDMPEDYLFNIFNEEKRFIGGVPIDINPITAGKSGSLEEYLPGVEKYLAEQAAKHQKVNTEQQEYKPLAKVEELEEQNYNMIDNRLNNIKPKAEEIKEQRQEEENLKREPAPKRRESVIAKLKANKAAMENTEAEKRTVEPKDKETRVV